MTKHISANLMQLVLAAIREILSHFNVDLDVIEPKEQGTKRKYRPALKRVALFLLSRSRLFIFLRRDAALLQSV